MRTQHILPTFAKRHYMQKALFSLVVLICISELSCKQPTASNSDLQVVGKNTSIANATSSRSTVFLQLYKSPFTAHETPETIAKADKNPAQKLAYSSCTGAYIAKGVILTAWHCVSTLNDSQPSFVFFHYNMAMSPTEDTSSSYSRMDCLLESLDKHADWRTQRHNTQESSGNTKPTNPQSLSTSEPPSLKTPVATIHEPQPRDCPDHPPMAKIRKVDPIGKGEVDLALVYFDQKTVDPYFDSVGPQIRPLPAALKKDITNTIIETTFEGYGETNKILNHLSITHLRKATFRLHPYDALEALDPGFYKKIEESKEKLTSVINTYQEKFKNRRKGEEIFKDNLHVFNPLYAHFGLYHISEIKDRSITAEVCKGDSGGAYYDKDGRVVAISSALINPQTNNIHKKHDFDMSRYHKTATDDNGAPVMKKLKCAPLATASMVAPYVEEIQEKQKSFFAKK